MSSWVLEYRDKGRLSVVGHAITNDLREDIPVVGTTTEKTLLSLLSLSAGYEMTTRVSLEDLKDWIVLHQGR